MKVKEEKVGNDTKVKVELTERVIDKMATLLTAAFGLVAALAWNDAIKALFSRIFGEQDELAAMFAYAIAVTVLAVVVTLWVGKKIKEIND